MRKQIHEYNVKRRITRKKILIIGLIIIINLNIVSVPTKGLDDSWRRRTDMPTPRAYFASSAVDGKIYSIGGQRNDDVLAIVEEFDPITNSWRRRTDMPTARYGLASAVVAGKIYAIGGYNDDREALNLIEEYDPATNSWSRRTDMPTNRGLLAATTLDGKIYALGGSKWRKDIDEWDVRNEVEVYDPVTNAWESRAQMIDDRDGFTAVSLSGKIYAIGGMDYNEDEQERYQRDSVEEYDPSTDSWHRIDDLTEPRANLAAVAIGLRIYVIGGYNNKNNEDNYLSIVEAYEPSIGRWSRWADMPSERSRLSLVMLAGWIYAIGGYNGNSELGTVEIYEPPAFDTDGDGLTDTDEIGRYQTDPLIADADTDTDADGLTNVEEVDIYGTDLSNPDSDNDGFTDSEEIDDGTDPNDSNEYPVTTTSDVTTTPDVSSFPEGFMVVVYLFASIIPLALLIQKRKKK